MKLTAEYKKRYRLYTLFFLLVAGLMATILIKTPPRFIPYLMLATPYVWLFGLWISFRGVNKRISEFEEHIDEESRVLFKNLRESIDIQTIFGLTGIAITLAMGWSIGHFR